MYYQINKDEDTFRTEIADANKQIAALKEKLGDHTILSDVPADAKFTDTWVPVQDNLTSESAENALSANQGRILNEKFGGLRLGKNDKGVWGYFVGDFFYPFKQGEALPEQVLNGVTFSNKNESNIVGTMPNNGAVKLNTNGSGNVIIPAGYHNGSGYVSGLGAYNSGRSQGQADVKNSPNNYGLYSSSQYSNGKTSVYNAFTSDPAHINNSVTVNYTMYPWGADDAQHKNWHEVTISGWQAGDYVEIKNKYITHATNLRQLNIFGAKYGESSESFTPVKTAYNHIRYDKYDGDTLCGIATSSSSEVQFYHMYWTDDGDQSLSTTITWKAWHIL